MPARGAGTLDARDTTLPNEMVECPACKGSGKWTGKRKAGWACAACGGTGKVGSLAK